MYPQTFRNPERNTMLPTDHVVGQTPQSNSKGKKVRIPAIRPNKPGQVIRSELPHPNSLIPLTPALPVRRIPCADFDCLPVVVQSDKDDKPRSLSGCNFQGGRIDRKRNPAVHNGADGSGGLAGVFYPVVNAGRFNHGGLRIGIQVALLRGQTARYFPRKGNIARPRFRYRYKGKQPSVGQTG